MIKCPNCEKESLIEVSRVYKIPFYSCNNEKCEEYATLVINVGDEESPSYVGYYEMIEAMNSMSEIGLSREEEPMLLGDGTYE